MDRKNPEELASFASLRYGRVLEILKEDASTWSDYASDGYVAGCRIQESDADGQRVDSHDSLLLRVSAKDALVGVRKLALEDVVAWWPSDGTEPFSDSYPSLVDGYMQPVAGMSQINVSTAREQFWAKITSHYLLSANRWSYDWVEQQRVGLSFEDKPGGRVSDPQHQALNSIEANNTGSGIQGNGIDISAGDFPAGFSLQPVQGNPVVMMYEDLGAGDTRLYSFSYVNAVDGAC